MHHTARTHRQQLSILAKCNAPRNIICLFLQWGKKKITFRKRILYIARLSFKAENNNTTTSTYHGWIDVKWYFECRRHTSFRVERKMFHRVDHRNKSYAIFSFWRSEEISIAIIVMNYVVFKRKEMILYDLYYVLMKKTLLQSSFAEFFSIRGFV